MGALGHSCSGSAGSCYQKPLKNALRPGNSPWRNVTSAQTVDPDKDFSRRHPPGIWRRHSHGKLMKGIRVRPPMEHDSARSRDKLPTHETSRRTLGGDRTQRAHTVRPHSYEMSREGNPRGGRQTSDGGLSAAAGRGSPPGVGRLKLGSAHFLKVSERARNEWIS